MDLREAFGMLLKNYFSPTCAKDNFRFNLTRSVHRIQARHRNSRKPQYNEVGILHNPSRVARRLLWMNQNLQREVGRTMNLCHNPANLLSLISCFARDSLTR
jgi:hypothetical protein